MILIQVCWALLSSVHQADSFLSLAKMGIIITKQILYNVTTTPLLFFRVYLYI